MVTEPLGLAPPALPVPTVMDPDAALESPVDSAREPLVPPVAPPLPNDTAPVAPAALLPVFSVSDPLAPAVPALADRIVIAPVVDSEPPE